MESYIHLITSGVMKKLHDVIHSRGARVEPGLKMLALIYEKTDFEFDDHGTQRHVLTMMNKFDKDDAASAANHTFEELALKEFATLKNSTLTIRYPERALASLAPTDYGFAPSVNDTHVDHDPGFDSIIVIWKAQGVDINNANQQIDLQTFYSPKSVELRKKCG